VGRASASSIEESPTPSNVEPENRTTSAPPATVFLSARYPCPVSYERGTPVVGCQTCRGCQAKAGGRGGADRVPPAPDAAPPHLRPLHLHQQQNTPRDRTPVCEVSDFSPDSTKRDGEASGASPPPAAPAAEEHPERSHTCRAKKNTPRDHEEPTEKTRPLEITHNWASPPPAPAPPAEQHPERSQTCRRGEGRPRCVISRGVRAAGVISRGVQV